MCRLCGCGILVDVGGVVVLTCWPCGFGMLVLVVVVVCSRGGAVVMAVICVLMCWRYGWYARPDVISRCHVGAIVSFIGPVFVFVFCLFWYI